MSIGRVAKLAGVSTSTVSRVINSHPKVSSEAEQAVRKAMRELRYTPSDRRPGPKPASRTERTIKHIEFLVFGSSGEQATPGFADLLRGVTVAAAEHDLDLGISHIKDPEQLPSRLMRRSLDGVLLHGLLPGSEVRRQLQRIPTVWLMGNRRRPGWGDQVMANSLDVGVIAASYLAQRGHRRCAFLNLDAEHWQLKTYGSGFAAAAREQGIEVIPLEQSAARASTDYWRRHTIEAADELVRRLMELSPRPTGLFVAEDMQLAFLQPTLLKHGIQLGRHKTEIVSCNNERPYLMGLSPRPAVIDIRFESIGRRGVEQLLWRSEHDSVPERIVSMIEPLLVPGLDDQSNSDVPSSSSRGWVRPPSDTESSS